MGIILVSLKEYEYIHQKRIWNISAKQTGLVLSQYSKYNRSNNNDKKKFSN